MSKKQFPVYFTEIEHQEFMDIAKKRRTTLNQMIRDALYAAKEDPNFLNPATEKTDLDVLIKILEVSANERIHERSRLLDRFDIIERKVDRLMEKAKIPKTEIRKLEGKDTSSEAVFDE